MNEKIVENSNQIITKFGEKIKGHDEQFNTIEKDFSSKLDTIAKIKKYKYVMFTFEATSVSDNNSKLVILLSNDGVSWVKLDFDYISPNLRDPFCFVKDDYYYIIATNLITHDTITYLRTKDLVNYEEVSYPYSGLANYERRWAPSVFKNGNDYYITMSLSTSNDSIYETNQYISKLDNNLIPTVWEKVKIKGNATSIYDAHFIITDKMNYIYYKNTQVGYEGIEIAQCNVLNGEYDIIGKLETDNKKEAPFIIKIENKLRLYLDTYEGEGGTTYKDMVIDLDYNKDIITNTNKKYKHCHILDLTGNKWESNFVLEPNFIELTDCNDNSIEKYEKRSITPTTLNLPNIPDDEKWGKISLYPTGSGNLIQELHLLNNSHFYRNYVGGLWSSWFEVIKDSNITNSTHRPNINVGGGIDINVLNVNGGKVVNIQGNLTNINKSVLTQNILTLDSNFRTKKNVTIHAINIHNWEDKHPFIELKTNGSVNLLIPGESLLKTTDYVFFNITYVV